MKSYRCTTVKIFKYIAEKIINSFYLVSESGDYFISEDGDRFIGED